MALKPSTEGIENVAFNDFTMGVDTTALVQAENIYEVSDAFSRILGKHGLKAGGELHANQINTHPDVIFNGSFAFNGSETGLDFADFLLGVPSSYTQGQARSFYNRNLYMAAFAQDSWKATSQSHPQLRRALGPHPPLAGEVQPAADAGQGRAVAGLSRRAAGLVFPGDPGVPRFAGPGRATTLLRASALPGRRLRRALAAQTHRASRAKPASASATASSIPPTKASPPAS